MQTEKSQNASYVCPYILEKIKADINNIRYLSIRPPPPKGKHGLVLGHSMGGMNAWIWGVKYPDFMDALVPMASQPSEMSSRNWMMRRLIIDSIRNDPDWNNGNYTTQPHAARAASVFSDLANAGGNLAFQKRGPKR